MSGSARAGEIRKISLAFSAKIIEAIKSKAWAEARSFFFLPLHCPTRKPFIASHLSQPQRRLFLSPRLGSACLRLGVRPLALYICELSMSMYMLSSPSIYMYVWLYVYIWSSSSLKLFFLNTSAREWRDFVFPSVALIYIVRARRMRFFRKAIYESSQTWYNI